MKGDQKLVELFKRNEEFFKRGEVKFRIKDFSVFKKGQEPSYFVLSCSDSRVVPEFFLGASLGELFVARIAGGVLCDEVISSLYFAVNELSVSTVLVIGHESCAAITAAYKGVRDDNIKAVIDRIEPYIKNAKNVDDAVRMFVSFTVGKIKELDFIKKKNVKVYGMFYHLDGRLEPL